MGAQLSSDTVNITGNVLAKTSVKTMQGCQLRLTQQQILDIENSRNITIRGNDFDQQAVFDKKCLETTASSNKVSANIKNSVNQIVKNINRAFELPNGGQQARTVSNIVNKIGSEIEEQFTQKCWSNLDQGQSVTLNNDKNVAIIDNNFRQSISDTISCTMKNVNTNDLAAQLDNVISQKASNTTKSALGGLILIIIVIIIIGGGMLLMGEKALFNWKLWLVLILAVIVYLAFAYFAKLWPFHKRQKGSNP